MRRPPSFRRGISLLELAIVLPLFLLLVAGVMEYSWMFLKAQQVTNAARAGARAGARIDATSTDITDAIGAAMKAAGLQDSGYTVDTSPENPLGLGPGAALSVTVSVSYEGIDLGMPLVPTPETISADVTMAREGEETTG